MDKQQAQEIVDRINALRTEITRIRAEEKRRIEVEFEGHDPGHFGWVLPEEENVDRLIEEINESGTHIWVETPLPDPKSFQGAVPVADWVDAIQELRAQWNLEIENLRKIHGSEYRVAGNELDKIAQKIGLSWGSVRHLVDELNRLCLKSARSMYGRRCVHSLYV